MKCNCLTIPLKTNIIVKMSLVMQLVIFDTIHVTIFGNKTFVFKLNVP